MAHHYSIKATYNAFATVVDGIVSKTSGSNVLSPLSLTTFGFLYLINDIWLNADNIVQVTWTNCDCDTTCD